MGKLREQVPYLLTQTLLDKELRKTRGLNNREVIGRIETGVG